MDAVSQSAVDKQQHNERRARKAREKEDQSKSGVNKDGLEMMKLFNSLWVMYDDDCYLHD